MSKTLFPHIIDILEPDVVFPQALQSTASDLDLVVQKLGAYRRDSYMQRATIEADIQFLKTCSSGADATNQWLTNWLLACHLPEPSLKEAHLCLSQIALLQETVAHGLNLLAAKLKSTDQHPTYSPLDHPITDLPLFLKHMEHDVLHDQVTLVQMEAFANSTAPYPPTHSMLDSLEADIETALALHESAKQIHSRWQSLSPTPAEKVSLHAAMLILNDHADILHKLQLLIPIVRSKIEPSLAAPQN